MRHRCVSFVIALLVVATSSGEAQRQQNAWVSLGFGQSSNVFMSDGFAGVVSGWYTNGPLAIGVRHANTATSGLLSSTDDPVTDGAGLIGLRTPTRNWMVLGALGYSSVHVPRASDSGALAYSLQASANYRIIGVAAELFGAEGSHDASFNAIALSVQLGWFGR